MAKDRNTGNNVAAANAKPQSFMVDVPEYPHHPAVITEGTQEEAVKAFQAKHGLDGLNLKWRVQEMGSNAAVAPVTDETEKTEKVPTNGGTPPPPPPPGK